MLVDPAAVVVKFLAVFAYAKIVDGHNIAIHLGPRGLCHIRLPDAFVGWFDGAPPDQHQQEVHEDADGTRLKRREQENGCRVQHQVQGRRWNAQPRRAQIKIERARGPQGGQREKHHEEYGEHVCGAEL